MTVDKVMKRTLSWFNGWVWPFLWIILIPAATIPWHGALLDLRDNRVAQPNNSGSFVTDCDCPAHVAVITLTPGLFNLVPYAWAARYTFWRYRSSFSTPSGQRHRFN